MLLHVNSLDVDAPKIQKSRLTGQRRSGCLSAKRPKNKKASPSARKKRLKKKEQTAQMSLASVAYPPISTRTFDASASRSALPLLYNFCFVYNKLSLLF
jgi:hypothetical protein